MDPAPEATETADAAAHEPTPATDAAAAAPPPPPCAAGALIPSAPGRQQPRDSDGLREIRAMVNLALPFPPLPMIISRPLQDEAGFMSSGTQVCSSHDFIAGMQNAVCALATPQQNREREYLQIRINADLMDRVDDWSSERRSQKAALLAAGGGAGAGGGGGGGDGDSSPVLPPIQWTYDLMCEFTRRYIGSYMPNPSTDHDIRFVPFDQIDRTHPVHTMALEFQKAQDTLYGKCRMLMQGEKYMRSYERMAYPELVQMTVARIMDCEQ